nr:MAG TPA: hypothetical protein [Caudoviricetes sp.]
MKHRRLAVISILPTFLAPIFLFPHLLVAKFFPSISFIKFSDVREL